MALGPEDSRGILGVRSGLPADGDQEMKTEAHCLVTKVIR